MTFLLAAMFAVTDPVCWVKWCDRYKCEWIDICVKKPEKPELPTPPKPKEEK